jgi:hypothetical protein
MGKEVGRSPTWRQAGYSRARQNPLAPAGLLPPGAICYLCPRIIPMPQPVYRISGDAIQKIQGANGGSPTDGRMTCLSVCFPMTLLRQ